MLVLIYIFFPCKKVPSPPGPSSVLFYARKDFLPSPSISLVLLSYVETHAVTMANVHSPNLSSDNSSIDWTVLTYIDDLALNV